MDNVYNECWAMSDRLHVDNSSHHFKTERVLIMWNLVHMHTGMLNHLLVKLH